MVRSPGPALVSRRILPRFVISEFSLASRSPRSASACRFRSPGRNSLGLKDMLKKNQEAMASTVLGPDLSRPGRKWSFGHCEYSEVRRQLLVNGQPVRMEGKQLDVLQRLLERPGEIVSSEALLDEVWKDVQVTSQSVQTAIYSLRKAFGGGRDSIIVNISGAGYRMAVPVTCVADEEPVPQPLRLKPGDAIPGKREWIADEPLGVHNPPHVWIAHHRDTKVARVFKLANDGIRLRALQRELTLSRIFAQKCPEQAGFSRVLESNFDEAPYFIETEYAGLDLYHFAETDAFRQMSTAERVELAAQMVEIVAAAHRLGILHNDLKPANILIGRRPLAGSDDWQVTVIDFGIATLTDAGRQVAMQLTHYGAFSDSEENHLAGGMEVRGSLLYLAPEMRAPGALPNPLSDIYALGVILFQIVTGDFVATPSAGWETRVADPLLRADIAHAAHMDPLLRTKTAEALAENLRTLEDRRRAEERKREEEKIRAAEQWRAARARRMWQFLAVVSSALAVGLAVCFWFYLQSVRALHLASERNAALQAMNRFLSQDLLAQSNPMRGTAASGQVQDESLLDAIRKASPQIDRRFSANPATAGQLHQTIGAAFEAQTHYAEAERQFADAAEQFRRAEGARSDDAIVAELRREQVLFRTRQAGAAQEAKAALAKEQDVIRSLPYVSPVVRAWNALTLTASYVTGAQPGESIPVLNDAIRAAEHSSGFDPVLLRSLRLRLCPAYFQANQPAKAEHLARQIISDIESHGGLDSRELFDADIFLQEALHEQGKYGEAIGQGSANYQKFARALGSDNQLTLAALSMKAIDEGESQRYADAIHDQLAVYQASRNLPAAHFLAENALESVAALECDSGHFAEGLHYATQLIAESSPDHFDIPAMAELGRFRRADCLLTQAEQLGLTGRKKDLDEAARIINTLDFSSVERLPGLQNAEGSLDVAKARLNILRGEKTQAAVYVAKATPLMQQSDADSFEKHKWEELKSKLQTR